MAKVVIETVAKHIEALKSQRLMGSYGVLTIKYGVLVEFQCQICFFFNHQMVIELVNDGRCIGL
jgi:hypothetical protein